MIPTPKRSSRKAAAGPSVPEAATPPPVDRAAVVIEWSRLTAKVAEAEARILQEVGVDKARLEQLESEIEQWHAELSPDLAAVIETDLGFLTVSAREYKREFSAQAKRAFFQSLDNLHEPLDAFELNQDKVKAHKGLKFLEQIITKERSGNRRLKWAPKAA